MYINTNRIILALALLQIAFPWLLSYMPGMDGPSHIYLGKVFGDLISGHCSLSAKYFEFTPTLVPNLISQIFSSLLANFLPGEIINKLFVSIILLGFWVGMYKLVEHINPKNIFILLFAGILGLNGNIFSGQYNYLMGMDIMLFAVLYWLKHQSKPSIFIIFLFSLTLYFSHIIAFLSFYFIIFYTLLPQIRSYDRKILFKLTLILIPFLAAFAHYYSLPKIETISLINFKRNLTDLFLLKAIFSYGKYDVWLLLFITISFWSLLSLAIYHTFKLQKNYLHIYGLSLLALITILTPSSFAGGWVIVLRLQLLFLIIATLFFASVNYSPRTRKTLIIFLTLLNLLELGAKYHYSEKLSNLLSEIALVDDDIENNKTYMTINISPSFYSYAPNEEEIFRTTVPDISGYFATQKCLGILNNFHASEINIFAVKYKNEYNPYFTMDLRDKYSSPKPLPNLDFTRYQSMTGELPDYIILIGKEDFMLSQINGKKYDKAGIYQKFMSNLEQYYQLKRSRYDNGIRLYERR